MVGSKVKRFNSQTLWCQFPTTFMRVPKLRSSAMHDGVKMLANLYKVLISRCKFQEFWKAMEQSDIVPS
jgi:hypothetical protein